MSAAVDWLGRAFARPGASAPPGETCDGITHRFRKASAAHLSGIALGDLDNWATWRGDPEGHRDLGADAHLTSYALRLLGRREREILFDIHARRMPLPQWAACNVCDMRRAAGLYRRALRNLGTQTVALRVAWAAFTSQAGGAHDA
jgi:hypothetical protein